MNPMNPPPSTIRSRDVAPSIDGGGGAYAASVVTLRFKVADRTPDAEDVDNVGRAGDGRRYPKSGDVEGEGSRDVGGIVKAFEDESRRVPFKERIRVSCMRVGWYQ